MYLNGDIIEFFSIPGWEWEIIIKEGKQKFIPDSNDPPDEIILKLPTEANILNSQLTFRTVKRYAKIQ